MSRYLKPLSLISSVIIGFPFLYQVSFAATAVNLRHSEYSFLNQFNNPQLKTQGIHIEETKRTIDFNHTLHIKVQESYMGYPIWGADAILHIPHGNESTPLNANLALQKQAITMNGIIYTDLAKDLGKGLPTLQNQSKEALTVVLKNFEQKVGEKVAIENSETKLIVYIDKDNRAHWAYKIKFDAKVSDVHALPKRPVFIIDAKTFDTYQSWDDIKTVEKNPVSGGGFGGNEKMGKLIYDELSDHLPKLDMLRDRNTCYLQNSHVTVKSYHTHKIISFNCPTTDPEHNNVYWNGDFDAVNGGYGPSNDALFGGIVINGMYQNWYGVPVLTENGKPMMLNMVVHDPIDNAYWDGRQMTFGDGVRIFYPLTSIGVAAHEISHGFTEQHSDLAYYSQSGGMNESFSDMAAQAAEFYAYGKNSWQIGPEIFKAKNEALRYMDQPSKDCNGGRSPGDWCSIDTVSQYYSGLDVHFSSGIYNRIFYLMGTATDWSTKKAFDVMVQANSNYWTSTVTFNEGACGVLSAAKDLGYDNTAILNAFQVVGIDTSSC